jgi:hypothetical protein
VEEEEERPPNPRGGTLGPHPLFYPGNRVFDGQHEHVSRVGFEEWPLSYGIPEIRPPLK